LSADDVKEVATIKLKKKEGHDLGTSCEVYW